MDCTETWSELLRFFKANALRHNVNASSMIAYCGDYEYKVIGGDKILVDNSLASNCVSIFDLWHSVQSQDVPISFYENCSSSYTGEASDF